MKAPKDFDRYGWSITYTTDGGMSWSTELLETRDDAAEFLRAALRENDDNDGFLYYVSLQTLVNAPDLLDETVCESRIRLIMGNRLVGVDGAENFK